MPPLRSTVRKKASRPADPTESLQDRKQRLVRADIGERAAAVLLERGFDAATIDDLARAAGISRRTFFRYFKTKEEVITADAAMSSWTEGADKDFGAALDEAFEALDALVDAAAR